jgi:protein-L-isoaspartate(D-aspartate) O-methyltransferase
MDYEAARRNMVESQLRANKVTDAALLEAFASLPRERFVPDGWAGNAYLDEDIPLGGSRHLMEPMVLARLLQAAEPAAEDMALDIGCATGYATAVLARLVSTVVALETEASLAEELSERLRALDIDNVLPVTGPLEAGHGAQAPYDIILLAGAVAEIPAVIREQLTDGGRLVTVVRGADGVGRAMLMLRVGDSFSSRVLFDASVPLLPGFEPAPSFVF